MLADHGDGTFTIKYSDGQTEEDVPEACARAVPRSDSRGSRSASRSRGGSGGMWRAVERMASDLAKKAGLRRKKIDFSTFEGESDEVWLHLMTLF